MPGNEKSKLERAKRNIIRQITSDKADVQTGLEENPSANLVNQLHSCIESWKEGLDKLKEIDDKLLDLIEDNLNQAESIKLEESITKDYGTLRRDLNIQVGKVKTMRDAIEEPRERPRRSMLNSSFLDATLTNPTIKIQDIPVPEFDGNIQNFPDWYSEFDSMINKNENLDNFQKMYLLKRSMVGSAKNLLKDYSSEPSAYPLAIDHVKKIFYNKRRIISGHFADLIDLPMIKLSSLREALEKIQRTIRGLQVCNLDVQKMSPLITFIVARKLPEKLRVDWENSQHDYSTYPSFDPMYNFLSNRCFAYETVNPTEGLSKEKLVSVNTPKITKTSTVHEKKSFAVSKKSPSNNNSLKCVVCAESHFLNQCKMFEAKSPSERFEIVKKHKLCIKCFNPFHTVIACKRWSCVKCQGNHHVMLHRDSNNNENSASSSISTSSTPIPSPTQQPITSSSSNSSTLAMCAVSSTKKSVILSTSGGISWEISQIMGNFEPKFDCGKSVGKREKMGDFEKCDLEKEKMGNFENVHLKRGVPFPFRSFLSNFFAFRSRSVQSCHYLLSVHHERRS